MPVQQETAFVEEENKKKILVHEKWALFIGSTWRHSVLSPPFLCTSHSRATCLSMITAATTTRGRSTKHSQKVHKVTIYPLYVVL